MRGFLSLGGNIGERRANLRKAVAALDALEGVAVLRVSHAYETEPVGESGQPAFVNLVVEIETAYQPLELLERLKRIEAGLGRKPSARWAPRLIDIDIILMGDTVVEAEALTVPHAAFRDRAFVLVPLAEIAPDARDPVTGKTAADLAARPNLQGRVIRTLEDALEPLRLEPNRDRDG